MNNKWKNSLCQNNCHCIEPFWKWLELNNIRLLSQPIRMHIWSTIFTWVVQAISALINNAKISSFIIRDGCQNQVPTWTIRRDLADYLCWLYTCFYLLLIRLLVPHVLNQTNELLEANKHPSGRIILAKIKLMPHILNTDNEAVLWFTLMIDKENIMAAKSIRTPN